MSIKARGKHFCFVRDLGWLEPLHLSKDLVMLPVSLVRTGWRSTVVCYKNPDDMVPEVWNGVRLLEVSRYAWPFHAGSTLVENWRMIRWLMRNARDIDVLMCMHIRRANVMFARIYRMLNPAGKVLVKTDTGLDVLESQWKQRRFRKNIADLVGQCDIMSFETRAAADGARERLSQLGIDTRKLRYIPNGFDALAVTRKRPLHEKEHLIITVGRIGAEEKNHELLLGALDRVELGDWKVVFIGPLEPGFPAVVEGFLKDRPNLNGKVVLAGKAANPEALFDLYDRASIFCFTSKRESFGLVLCEALYFDDYIVTTDVGAARDVVIEGKNGTIVGTNDLEGFARALGAAIGRDGDLVRTDDREYIDRKKTFAWEKIVGELEKQLGLSDS